MPTIAAVARDIFYQGPLKSSARQDDEHFLTVCRYVERNALSGRLVASAEDWEFGSPHRWHHGRDRDPQLLSPLADPASIASAAPRQ